MADKITNAYDTYTSTGSANELREDLADIVYLVSPETTPVMQAIGSRDVSQPTFDWLVQSLPSASATASKEGEEITRSASTGTTRRTNVCMIKTRNATVTNTNRASTHAGISEMMAHQIQLCVRALKTDIETMITQKKAKATGSATVARESASLSSWLTSNTTHHTAGSSATGDGTDTITDGSATQALAKSHLNSAMQSAFGNSSELPTLLICGPFNKTKISAFDESSTNMRRMVDANQVGSSVTVVATDFGDLEVVPDNFSRERDVFLLNPDYVRLAYLRNFERQTMGSIGDGVTEAIYTEVGVQVDNEATQAIVADRTVS